MTLLSNADYFDHVVRTLDEQKFMKVLRLALMDYKMNHTVEQFEKDFDCEISYDERGFINGVYFNGQASRTALYLRYSK